MLSKRHTCTLVTGATRRLLVNVKPVKGMANIHVIVIQTIVKYANRGNLAQENIA